MERSFTEVLQDTFLSVRDIIRSEVRLARTEIAADAQQMAGAGKQLGVAALVAFYAGILLCLGLAHLLANWMSLEASYLLVGVVLAGIAAALFFAGQKKWKEVRLGPERTVESVKENVEWLTNRTK